MDRISQRGSSKSSSKTRSQSVPLKTILSNVELDNLDDSKSNLNETSIKASASNNIDAKSGANMKTLQLMAKMQAEHDEKQKRRKMRQKLTEQQKMSKSTSELKIGAESTAKSPKSDHRFLSSIMNTLFPTSTNDSTSSSSNNDSTLFQKNEAKRLSLRKLKAKDKAKKKPEEKLSSTAEAQSDEELDYTKGSQQSLNFIKPNIDEDEYSDTEAAQIKKLIAMKSSSFDGSCSSLAQFQNNFKPVSIGMSSISTRFGKIKNEKDKPLNENNKENLMKKLKAELAEEIKDRKMLEMKQNIINGTSSTSSSTSSNSSDYDNLDRSVTLNRKSLKDTSRNEGNRKIRSKSVTFLDELSTDEENPAKTQQSNVNLSNSNEATTPASSRKSLKTGDVRLMCGALTGVGPIRGIMKKSATDLSITLNSPVTNKTLNIKTESENRLPKLQLTIPQFEDKNYIQVIPKLNVAKKKELVQSDL